MHDTIHGTAASTARPDATPALHKSPTRDRGESISIVSRTVGFYPAISPTLSRTRADGCENPLDAKGRTKGRARLASPAPPSRSCHFPTTARRKARMTDMCATEGSTKPTGAPSRQGLPRARLLPACIPLPASPRLRSFVRISLFAFLRSSLSRLPIFRSLPSLSPCLQFSPSQMVTESTFTPLRSVARQLSTAFPPYAPQLMQQDQRIGALRPCKSRFCDQFDGAGLQITVGQCRWQVASPVRAEPERNRELPLAWRCQRSCTPDRAGLRIHSGLMLTMDCAPSRNRIVGFALGRYCR